MLQKLNNQGYTFTDNGRVIVVDKYGAVKRVASGSGGVPSTRTITINGVSYDLSADRSWDTGVKVTTSSTAPTSPSVGDIWINI
jgi:hypothetical protein